MTRRLDVEAVAALLDAVDVFSDREFGPPFDDATLGRLRRRANVRAALAAIITDDRAPSRRRLTAVAAADQLGSAAWHTRPAVCAAAAEVLAWGLANDPSHNRWGLPGERPGYLGAIVLGLPCPVDHAFVPLIDDSRPLLVYGSEAATLAELRHPTVGALAADLVERHRRSAGDVRR